MILNIIFQDGKFQAQKFNDFQKIHVYQNTIFFGPFIVLTVIIWDWVTRGPNLKQKNELESSVALFSTRI